MGWREQNNNRFYRGKGRHYTIREGDDLESVCGLLCRAGVALPLHLISLYGISQCGWCSNLFLPVFKDTKKNDFLE